MWRSDYDRLGAELQNGAEVVLGGGCDYYPGSATSSPSFTFRAARILRRRLLTLPGRLTRTARRWTLHLPARWPWQEDFTAALTRLRALPAPG